MRVAKVLPFVLLLLGEPASAKVLTGSLRLVIPAHSFAVGVAGVGSIGMIGGTVSALFAEWVELETGAIAMFAPEDVLSVAVVARAGLAPAIFDRRGRGAWVLRVPFLAGYRWQYFSGDHENRPIFRRTHCLTFDLGLAATRWWLRVGLELRIVAELLAVLSNIEENRGLAYPTPPATFTDYGRGVAGGATFTIGLSF